MALQTLCYYGISTKEQLEMFMRSAFLNETKKKKEKSLLDVFFKNYYYLIY